MLTRQDIGKLKPGMRVTVNGRTGTVVGEHEPQWRDHQTRRWIHELQGADIRFDDEAGCARYIHCDQITIEANSMSDTPRTDEETEQWVLTDKNHPHTDWVPASFARQLERENTQLRDALSSANTEIGNAPTNGGTKT